MAEIRGATPFSPVLLVHPENSAGLELVGLNIYQPHADRNVVCYQILQVGSFGSYQAINAPLDGFLADRCYVHGGLGSIVNGISLYVVLDATIKNCYIDETHGGGESHGIHVFVAPGPTLIENNYIMSAGINVFIGDSSLPAEYSPDNVSIIRNHIYKPIIWHPLHASYNPATAWAVKNHIESKGGVGLHIEGNLMQNSWVSSQDGDCFLISNFAKPVGNVIYRNNVMKNIARGMTNSNVSGHGINGLVHENNLIYNSLPVSYLSNQYYTYTVAGVNSGVVCRHNTVHKPNGSGGWMSMGGAQNFLSDMVHKDNLCTVGGYGINSALNGSTGRFAVDTHCVTFDFNTHVALGPLTGSDYPPNYNNGTNFVNWIWQSNVSAVQFSNYAFTQISHFALASGSPYKNAGTDGTDIGCNIPALLAAMNQSEINRFPTD